MLPGVVCLVILRFVQRLFRDFLFIYHIIYIGLGDNYVHYKFPEFIHGSWSPYFKAAELIERGGGEPRQVQAPPARKVTQIV